MRILLTNAVDRRPAQVEQQHTRRGHLPLLDSKVRIALHVYTVLATEIPKLVTYIK